MFRSHLDDSLPRSVPVAPGIFDALHKLDSLAWELEYSQFHPACNPGTVETIKRALKTFAEGRSSFIDNGASLKKSQDAFSEVKKLLDDDLRWYNVTQQVMQASRDNPLVGSPVEESNPNQKWDYGFVAVTARTAANPGKYTQVTLRNDISAYEALLETAPIMLSPKILRFSSSRSDPTPRREEEGSTSREVDPSTVTVSGMRVYIIGWTLSCRTPGKSKKKKFTVQSGGLKCSNLAISVNPVSKTRAHTWRCRIYFVDKEEYGSV
jgi:hypothetical protein